MITDPRCRRLAQAWLVGLFLASWGLAPDLASAAGLRTVTIAYVDRAEDEAYAASRGYEGVYDATLPSPFPGAALAVNDAKLVGQAIGVQFALEHITLPAEADAAAAINKLASEKPLAGVLLDLPITETAAVANGLSGVSIPLFQARHRDTLLRQATCRSHLFHTLPSWDMLEDALAQSLVARNWRRILVLESAEADDKAVSAAFQRSAAKFGLAIAGVKTFVGGHDPRQRESNNLRLLTGDADYDVVFVADAAGDFARALPYNTALPRPVIGAAGLMPVAWHAFWERQGAPQLNRRFAKASKRAMTEADWATWAAVRAIIEATVRSKDHAATSLLDGLTDPALTLELYKGNAGSFRPWNRQLRQPILLATVSTVAGFAPVEGMLHQSNTLDTLGLDAPEFACP